MRGEKKEGKEEEERGRKKKRGEDYTDVPDQRSEGLRNGGKGEHEKTSGNV